MIMIKKIKAGALQFVLFIGVVVAILLMSFLLLTHTHKQFEDSATVLIAMIRQANMALDKSLQESFEIGEELIIKDENELDLPTAITRDYWGIFEKRTVVAKHPTREYTKIGLIGGSVFHKFAALYLSENKRPLILAGNAKITGDAYVPASGINTGSIYGNAYNLPRTLYGVQKESSPSLPNISEELKAQLALMVRKYDLIGTEVAMESNAEIKNSFDLKTKVLSGREVVLNNTVLLGNIVINAEHKIVVTSSAQLKDVLLIAPQIEIQDNVAGNFQAIATTSIKVGKYCKLGYPTALVLNKKEQELEGYRNFKTSASASFLGIYIDQFSKITGSVLSVNKNKSGKPEIAIEANAEVIGEIYCANSLELKGRVTGTVITNSFIAMENGNAYQNHLYNGRINSEKLPKVFVGMLLSNREEHKKLMKWLY